jgi:tRNA nucleotidyltransferase (CCA-adding enzyme)
MQVIVTHELADFDALAAAVAAQKLHPGAVIAVGRHLGHEVRDFLALHKDRFQTLHATDIDEGDVRRLIVVDVRRKSRLAAFPGVLARIEQKDPTLEIYIYDHHPASLDDLVGDVEIVEPLGSATTLLVERIRSRGVEIDSIEATLFALGIHADTGSLTHALSTSRDAAAVGWLMDQGVELDVLNRYLRPPFSLEQRKALCLLLERMRVESMGGLPIGFALIDLDDAIDGLADVTSEALALTAHAALFVVYEVGRGRLQVIGRARSPLVDVGRRLAAFGGGGHGAAGAAVVKDVGGELVLEQLAEALRADPPRATRVADIMSTPVRTVPHNLVLSDVDRSLAALGHTGAPVLRDGRLVGIVSRRDVERARRDGRLELPVSSCMSHELVTASPDETLEIALTRMTEADVGRLVVVREGRLVGIVTRSDVLAALYGDAKAARSR